MATPKKSSQQRNIIIIIVLAILALLITSQFEKRRVKDYQQPSKLAQRDSFLALSRLFKPHNIIIDNQELNTLNIRQFPHTQDILMLINGGELQSLSDQKRLLDWVHEGGRLIIVADSPSITRTDDEEYEEDEENNKQKLNVLTRMGISAFRLDYPEHFNKKHIYSKSGDDSVFQFELQLPNSEKVNWHFSSDLPDVGLRYSSTDDLVYKVKMPQSAINASADMAIQLQLGDGQLLVLNNARWLNNNQLKHGDNGHIALQLLSNLKNKNTTTKLHIFSANPYNDTPNLIKWLWQHVPYSILAAILCLFLWLWHYRFISGPKLTPIMDSRRNLLEHLRATGWFIYRADKGMTWIKQLNQQFQQSLSAEKNISQFIVHSRYFQHNIIARFNQFNRYNPFSRHRKTSTMDSSSKDK